MLHVTRSAGQHRKVDRLCRPQSALDLVLNDVHINGLADDLVAFRIDVLHVVVLITLVLCCSYLGANANTCLPPLDCLPARAVTQSAALLWTTLLRMTASL